LFAVLLLAGCVGTPRGGEVWAREDVKTVRQVYRPAGERPVLPELTTNAGLGDFVRYAILNQPQVEAAYYDWAAAVEKITTERSLPDPQLTFQTFNTSTLLSSLMFGLVMEFPGPGKLGARAAVASAESEAKYSTFEASVLDAVFGLKKAYYNLYYLDAQLRIKREMAQSIFITAPTVQQLRLPEFFETGQREFCAIHRGLSIGISFLFHDDPLGSAHFPAGGEHGRPID